MREHLVTDAELAMTRGWASAKLEGVAVPERREPGLVIRERGSKGIFGLSAGIERNGFHGNPLRLGEAWFEHGLMCTTDTVVEVRLPGPACRFSAVVGLEYDDYIALGKAAFIVRVEGREEARTTVTRGYGPGVPLAVDLHGARSFTIEVRDAEGDWSHDHATWADATVDLVDGSAVRLGDLPVVPEAESWTLDPPFSFTLDSRSSGELLPGFRVERASRDLDTRRMEHVVTYADPATRLRVRCVAVEYRDVPVVEWTLHLENTGPADTALIEDIAALDLVLERTVQDEFVLHHGAGCTSSPGDYRPFATTLEASSAHRYHAHGGRATNGAWPYFNVEWPDQGVIVAVGWIGQWVAQFARDGGRRLRVRAGQELTHFVLRPGEEVRTPSIALLFYRGGWVRAQNLWRRWLRAHVTPRIEGELPAPMLFGSSAAVTFEMDRADEASQLEFIDRYLEEGIGLDKWWMDAGWHSPRRAGRSWWNSVGTWTVDADRFPRGLRTIADHAREKGMGTIVWFEPERVYRGSWLFENRPEWLLAGSDPNTRLLNLAHPEARRWLTDHIDAFITEQGIDVYRQDCNMDPLEYWCANDAPDRQGITEIRHIEGLLTHWDELLRRHPRLLIDSVSSGHRRNDLEGLRRSVSFTRTDYLHEPVAQQSHAYGIFFWMPYHAGAVKALDPYLFRSAFTAPHAVLAYDMRAKGLDYGQMRRLVRAWRATARYYLGDYYPLTSYSLDTDQWMAWQFDLPEAGEGMVQAFRRHRCRHEAERYRLRNLDPRADYMVRNLDTRRTQKAVGRELMERGFWVRIADAPGTAIVTYQRRSR